MDQPFVWIKVAGRTCLGYIAGEPREKWGSQWVTVEPVIGFAIPKDVLLSDVQYAIDFNKDVA